MGKDCGWVSAGSGQRIGFRLGAEGRLGPIEL